MMGLEIQPGMTGGTESGGGGGLPAKDDVKRTNTFSNSNTSGSHSISASSAESTASTHPLWEAWDGDELTGGSRWAGQLGSLPEWIVYNFGAAQVVYTLRMYPHSRRSPETITVESSENGTDWTLRHTETGITATIEWKTITLDTPAEAQYWRINFTALNGDGATYSPRVRELELLS